MAFRTKTASCLILFGVALAGPAVLNAQALSLAARHDHLRKGGAGQLMFGADGVRWAEEKEKDHSRFWPYADLQSIELSPAHVRIVTYEDNRRQFGRDRVYRFDHLNANETAKLYPLLMAALDQRFLPHIADPGIVAWFETPAKLLLGRGGSSGVLKVGTDLIVFDGGQGESRTWRVEGIGSLSSTGPFDLSFLSGEVENRFQLKAALPEERYNELWRRVMERNGLKVYQGEGKHEH